jgi:hypothetical protein
MTYKQFQIELISRSATITTCFHMDEAEDTDFERMHAMHNAGWLMDDIIWNEVARAYPEDNIPFVEFE